MLDKLKEKFQDTIDYVEDYTESNTWSRYLKGMIQRFALLSLPRTSAASSYYILFSLFPLILFMISLLNLIDPDILQKLGDPLPEVGILIPEPVAKLLKDFIKTSGIKSNISVLSIAGIGLLWSASSATSNIINSLNKIYNNRKKSKMNIVVSRILGVISSLFFGIILIAILLLLSFSSVIVTWLSKYFPVIKKLIDGGLNIAAYVVSFIILFLIFILIYTLMSKNKFKFRYTLIAATFSSVTWILISFIISNILSNNARYDVIYGSLASIIFLMLWMYLAVLTLLIGAFIHTEMQLYHDKKDLIKRRKRKQRIKR